MSVSRARLAKLEARRRGRGTFLSILCAASGVWAEDPSAKPPGIWTATDNRGRAWERAGGEGEDDFLGRVLADASGSIVDAMHYGDAPADVARIRRTFGVTVFDERTFLDAVFHRPDGPAMPLPGAAP